jgi:hypothetical protein
MRCPVFLLKSNRCATVRQPKAGFSSINILIGSANRDFFVRAYLCPKGASAANLLYFRTAAKFREDVTLAIAVGQRLGGEHVVATLNQLVARRRAPKYMFVDNTPSSRVGCSTSGRPTTTSTSTSTVQANRPTTATWKPSTDRYATNA